MGSLQGVAPVISLWVIAQGWRIRQSNAIHFGKWMPRPRLRSQKSFATVISDMVLSFLQDIGDRGDIGDSGPDPMWSMRKYKGNTTDLPASLAPPSSAPLIWHNRSRLSCQPRFQAIRKIDTAGSDFNGSGSWGPGTWCALTAVWTGGLKGNWYLQSRKYKWKCSYWNDAIQAVGWMGRWMLPWLNS